jgi:8-amino-7-oxononanoate synthase
VALDVGHIDRGLRLVSNASVDAIPSASELEVDGARWLSASTDDVLGLASDPRVREAAASALKKFGLHRASLRTTAEFEATLARALGHRAALVVSELWDLLRVLPTWRFAVDGRARLLAEDATSVRDPDDAETALAAGLDGVLVDALFPAEGDLAPLPRYAEVCAKVGAALVVVDRLGLGMLGSLGAGAVEHLGVSDQARLTIASFGAAVPGIGAVVAGDDDVITALRGHLTAPPAVTLLASARAWDIVRTEPQRAKRAFDVAQQLLNGLKRCGFDTGPCVTPWIPVWVGEPALCHEWLSAFAEASIAMRAWVAPGESRLLLSMSATATDAQLQTVLDTFERLGRRLMPPSAIDEPREAPIVARPGSYVLHAPASSRWFSQAPRPTRPAEREPSPAALPLRERVFDTVETLTWRATNVSSQSIRRTADALRALFDRRRK